VSMSSGIVYRFVIASSSTPYPTGWWWILLVGFFVLTGVRFTWLPHGVNDVNLVHACYSEC
jgi:hypothetical protein